MQGNHQTQAQGTQQLSSPKTEVLRAHFYTWAPGVDRDQIDESRYIARPNTTPGDNP